MTRPESGAESTNLTALDLDVIRLFADKLTEQSVDESSIDALIEGYKQERTPSADALLSKFKQTVEESGVEESK